MPEEPQETPRFDQSAIEKLRQVAGDQGTAFVAEMAQLVLDETIKSTSEIAKARDQGDWKAVTRIAHSLKSSAATLGFMRLSAACRALEVGTKSSTSAKDLGVLAAAVLDEFEQVRPILKGMA